MKKNMIFQGALSVMTALLLCTSCSSDDLTTDRVAPVAPVGKVIHYTATVGEGDETRATLNESKKYVFQAGDKLVITGTDISGELTLATGAGTASATFSGDLTYEGSGTPADDLTLNAVLESTSKPNDMTLTYASAEYPSTAIASASTDIAARQAAVEKYSYFTATSTYADRSFTVSQQTSFLDFTVTFEDGTTSETEFTIDIKNGGETVRTGSVTTATESDKVVAHFVAAMPKGTVMSSATVQLGSKAAISFGGSTTLAANKIYNISKTVAASGSGGSAPAGALSGKFSVSDTKKVYFSKGNLQATYDGTSWTWKFAEHQYDYIGDAEGNTKVSDSSPYVSGYSGTSTTVDLFGWVGASSSWDDVNKYGISSSLVANNTDGYGNVANESLKSDWGNLTISNADGHTWSTLTSGEWKYIFSSRSSGATVNGTENARWTHATINTDGTAVNGVILFPDGCKIFNVSATSWGTINSASTWDSATKCTTAQWTHLEELGCVFLPAAGFREGSDVYIAGTDGFYWSSSPYVSSVNEAYTVGFNSNDLNPAYDSLRFLGYSVRLVRLVE